MTEIGVQSAPGNTQDQTRNVRVRAWMHVFECWHKKKAAGTSGGVDAKGSKNDRATYQYTR